MTPNSDPMAATALTAFLFGAGAFLFPTAALAFEPNPPAMPQAVFALGGVMTEENMGRSANPFTVDYEWRIVVAAGFQQYLHETRHGVQLGMEIGLGVRAIAGVTAELWAGPVIRHEGVVLFDRVRVSPSFTAALSAVTDAHPGRERRQEELYDGDARLLFYLGPELNISRPERPDRELFWRLHHRSGANGTLGAMRGAMNATTLGVRFRF